jgi:GDP-L-fucose synthase
MHKFSKIYIAGHTGLIGSAFLRKFQGLGYENLLIPRHKDLELTDKKAVFDFFMSEKPEYVVLAAGKVGGIIENRTYPADFITTNLAIQQNVIEAANKSAVQKLIYFGSSCMYPRECAQPMSENALYSGKPEYTSIAYAVAKMAGIQACLAYNDQFKVKRFIPVIPNSAYGPGDNFDPNSGHVLSSLIARFHQAKVNQVDSLTLWGSGSPRREFIHVDDIVDACIKLLDSDIQELELPVNLGSGSDISIKELAVLISKVIRFDGEIKWDLSKPDGSPRKLLDSSRFNQFGWFPKVSFDKGIRETYDWYLEKISKLNI